MGLLGQSEEIFLGTVLANDLDDWDINDKIFTFIDEDDNKLFRLNNATGQLYTRTKLHDESYNIFVRVYDMRWKHGVTSTVKLAVTMVPNKVISNAASVKLLESDRRRDCYNMQRKINNRIRMIKHNKH
ncbi:hypothetical protein HELRODRAFT_175865 [Helobdella robusta]|uniref:Cadherin domain-containing protein n=1 Tax=Helobdella robusta TaxID=6412 RepID=T1F9S6_HELRO|nr:hypothetical protein HELRODRAFT_175865 [Helobdella robusta]ESO00435.1 hypothetical protein HELRODRAFT_175865 [Helobdella robusta]